MLCRIVRPSVSKSCIATRTIKSKTKSIEESGQLQFDKIRKELTQKVTVLAKVQDNFINAVDAIKAFEKNVLPEAAKSVDDLEISWKEKMTQLSQQYSTQEFELKLNFKTQQEEMTQEFLKETSRRAVCIEDYANLQNKLASFESEAQNFMDEKISALEKNHQISLDRFAEISEHKYKADIATIRADAAKSASEVESSNALISVLQKELQATRENVRHVAEAAKAPGISQSIAK